MKIPCVFISYSHDSAEHKEWVLDLATTLRNRGVDAVLDQWDLKPGDDLPTFMEQNLATADFALMICTNKYVEKANAGEGGVGYEKMIMTSQSLSNISKSKVIPLIREKGEPSVPTFMETKVYVDFSDDSEEEYALDELLRKLLDAPLYVKPEIGKAPFKPLESARPDRTADGVKQFMTDVTDCFDSSNDNYVFYAAVIRKSSMRRLTVDKYRSMCIREGLIIVERYRDVARIVPPSNTDEVVYLTNAGLKYLDDHGIVET